MVITIIVTNGYSDVAIYGMSSLGKMLFIDLYNNQDI